MTLLGSGSEDATAEELGNAVEPGPMRKEYRALSLTLVPKSADQQALRAAAMKRAAELKKEQA